ncbi:MULTISPECIES: hypothetical protein [unclassified Streptomyces]|uniref:hypothetical protein n=1 Tax=unclassified Streptomyces TaxID=2593676 RepID=UPI0013A6BA3C|nr:MULTISPECIES: hypothetical protein [unclassified Streptomyces]
MITEPEFDGGSSGSPEPPGLPEAYEEGPGPLRRPWRWALGGALLASALWAGAWGAVAPQDGRPPLRYALPMSLCDEAKLPALARLAETAGWEYTPRLWEHPGVDQALCMLSTPRGGSQEPPAAPSLAYEVQVSVTLHKLTDPAPEFGADPGGIGWIGTVRSDPRSVPGLGERALITEAEYGKWWRLTVLDGGAVFTMDVSVWTDTGDDGRVVEGEGPLPEPPKPDTDALQAAMIDDMHTLMKVLRG